MQYTKGELTLILDNHVLWLNDISNGRCLSDAKRAILRGAILTDADLRGAILRDVTGYNN
jgi:uncharacterized protein YjbI with pentapeptide repeats